MVRFVNKNGGIMIVDESRVEEYLAAGHKVANAPAPVVAIEEPKAKKRPIRRGKE